MKRPITILLLAGLLISIEAFGQANPREFEMKDGDTTYIMKKYFMCVFKKGLEPPELDSLQLAEIQQGHLANIKHMAEAGKVVIAGPFEGDFDLRGILVFDVDTAHEADSLLQADPAVKAGRLAYDLYPWWAAKGSKLP